MAIFDHKTQDDRHLGPRLPRGLRLGRHCPLQVLRQSHIFHLEEQIWEQGTHIWFLFGHLVSSPRLAQCQCPKGRLQCRSSSESEYFQLISRSRSWSRTQQWSVLPWVHQQWPPSQTAARRESSSPKCSWPALTLNSKEVLKPYLRVVEASSLVDLE